MDALLRDLPANCFPFTVHVPQAESGAVIWLQIVAAPPNGLVTGSKAEVNGADEEEGWA